MKKIVLFILFILAITMTTGCKEESLIQDNLVDAPRILAIKISDPVFQPESKITMSIKVAAKDTGLLKTARVEWLIGNQVVVKDYGQDGELTIPKAEDLIYFVPKAQLDVYNSRSSVEMVIKAKVIFSDSSAPLYGEKTVILTKPEMFNTIKFTNPEIEKAVVYSDSFKKTSSQINDSDSVDIKGSVSSLLFGVNLKTANSDVVFEWIASSAKSATLTQNNAECSISNLSDGDYRITIVARNTKNGGVDFFDFVLRINPADFPDTDKIADTEEATDENSAVEADSIISDNE